MQAFKRTTCWIFDLDNTLYPAHCNLFAQVDQRMGEYVARFLGISFDEARRLQKSYYHSYGTTLRGLMQQHGMDPHPFLDYVHDIDLSPVSAAPKLCAALRRLPGRKYIFTNGTRRHAENVAARLGVLECFDDVFDIGAADFIPKPDREAYVRFLETHAVAPAEAAMFEDLPHNLETPHDLGMVTVLVKSTYIDHPAHKAMASWTQPPPHVHHMTDDLTGFLEVLGSRPQSAQPQAEADARSA